MKKILVLGAGGTVGEYVIKYLLSEGRYEITAVDIKNKKTLNKLKRFRRRVNVVFGDVTDRILIEALVKDHDYVVYLASAMPPLGNIKSGLSASIDYGGCENVVRAINYYNPKCHLFLASTTSVYKEVENPSVKSKINLSKTDYFEKAKLDCEKLVKEKLKNYTIYRIPLVLSNPLEDAFIYDLENREIDYITKEDCAYAFVKGISYSKELNKKTFNLGSKDTVNYKTLRENILLRTGINAKYVLSRIFLSKDYKSPVCSDKNELEDLIKYRNDSLNEYYKRLKMRVKKRKFRKWIAKMLIERKR